MKTNFSSSKATTIAILILLCIGNTAMASSFTASFSGNWSSASNWLGYAPGFNTGTGSTIVIPAGVTLTLDSDLVVSGSLQLNGGILNLNGRNLTISGGITTTGLGSITGNRNSDITFNGYGGAGDLVFSSTNQMVNNLTINIGSNSGVFLGSALTVCGTLSLTNGYLGILNDDLIISGKGSMQGGSRSSYIMTSGAGKVMAAVSNSATPYIFQVGTQNDYAPIAVTNNSNTTEIFAVSAFEGVLTEGCTGNNISASSGMINTTWNISSPTSTDPNITLEVFWSSDMQVNGFSNNLACVSQYTSDGWNTQLPLAATVNGNGTFSVKLAGVTSFGQLAVFGGNTATGINNVASNTFFELYPNPATNMVNVSVGLTGSFPLLKMYDIAGNEVLSQQMENNLTSLDINNLSTGTYFISLNGDKAKEFIKE